MASDGLTALAKLKAEPYDAVLMDVQMPQKNGYDTTREWRRHEQEQGLARIPIIGLTAHATAADREKCLAVGMDDYISKPFDPALLHEKITALLKAQEKKE